MTVHTDTQSTTPATPANHEPALRKVFRLLGDALLTLLAIAGAICIVAVIAAFVFHIHLIMFKTGSMAPTIPTGSLAVVRDIPAAEIQIGDVATVQRGEGELPITHRVIAKEPILGPLGAPTDTWRIELKGDANPQPDPSPYEVTTVGKVLWSAPKLAYVVATIGTPKSMAVITVVISGVVVWALWPRTAKNRSAARPAHRKARR